MSGVLINARAAVRRETGGVERWARELAARLPAIRPGRYAVARPPPHLAHQAGHAWEQVVLPALALRGRARLILSPANLAPLASGSNVVIVHDAAVLRHPEWFSRPYAVWERRALGVLARRAVQVVTVSEFSRRELLALLPLDPGRVSVVPGGVGEAFQPDADPEPARHALGLSGPYVLSVGTDTRRKNFAALDRAAADLARAGYELVVAGGTRGYLQPGGAAGRALGYVPEAHLPGLYAGARAFVLPSLYEGFGLPCLEAMAAGTPVVAADRGGLPEACGGAALLVDPEDAAAVGRALDRAVGDEELRERLVAAGRERAGELSWARTAREVDEVLDRLL
jgi:glycosyltransferase involved in cell wall biosynthesis